MQILNTPASLGLFLLTPDYRGLGNHQGEGVVLLLAHLESLPKWVFLLPAWTLLA